MHVIVNNDGIQLRRWHKTPTPSSYARVLRLMQAISYYQHLTSTSTIYYI